MSNDDSMRFFGLKIVSIYLKPIPVRRKCQSVKSKVTNKEVYSNLYIKAVTSDDFDENIVTSLNEPWL